jgi:hypothetical protein
MSLGPRMPVPALLKANRLVAGLRLAFDRVALCGEAFESAEENAWLPSHERFINSHNCDKAIRL